MSKIDAILKFTIKLDRSYQCDLNEDLEINKAEINEELANQPSQFAWYAVLSEMAKNATLIAKNELELEVARLDPLIRKDWDTDKYGRMTEAGVESVMKMLTSHKAKMEAYLNAKKNEGLMLIAKQAFEQRKDMLISIASNMRAEFDADLKINKQKVADKIKKLKGD